MWPSCNLYYTRPISSQVSSWSPWSQTPAHDPDHQTTRLRVRYAHGALPHILPYDHNPSVCCPDALVRPHLFQKPGASQRAALSNVLHNSQAERRRPPAPDGCFRLRPKIRDTTCFRVSQSNSHNHPRLSSMSLERHVYSIVSLAHRPSCT
jgi:hypothetical protein